MANSKVRIGGSGFTVMLWNNNVLAYLQTLQDTPPQPVAQAQAVQPIDAAEPLEIVTPLAVGPGTLKLTFYERWDNPVWAMLGGERGEGGPYAGAGNLLEVLTQQFRDGSVTLQKLIGLPGGAYRTYTYTGCVIVDVDQGEQITIGTMTLPKTITVQYTSVNRT